MTVFEKIAEEAYWDAMEKIASVTSPIVKKMTTAGLGHRLEVSRSTMKDSASKLKMAIKNPSGFSATPQSMEYDRVITRDMSRYSKRLDRAKQYIENTPHDRVEALYGFAAKNFGNHTGSNGPLGKSLARQQLSNIGQHAAKDSIGGGASTAISMHNNAMGRASKMKGISPTNYRVGNESAIDNVHGF